MNPIKVGMCIKRNRIKLQMTLNELAEQTDINICNIEAFETGIRLPRYKEFMSISKVLKIPPIVLAHGGGVIQTRERNEKGEYVCEWREY